MTGPGGSTKFNFFHKHYCCGFQLERPTCICRCTSCMALNVCIYIHMKVRVCPVSWAIRRLKARPLNHAQSCIVAPLSGQVEVEVAFPVAQNSHCTPRLRGVLHYVERSSNDMKWNEMNGDKLVSGMHSFLGTKHDQPTNPTIQTTNRSKIPIPVRFAPEWRFLGKSFLPKVWGRGTFTFYFFVLMRIFAWVQRKYLLSTILKYERFLLANPRHRPRPAANTEKRLRLRKQLEGTY